MKHFLQDMEQLTRKLLQLAETVVTTIQNATKSLRERRSDLAEQIIAGDDAIDQEEVRIEAECTRILVLYLPVATDLRRVIAALKINGDLERMADLAADIAEEAVQFSQLPEPVPLPPNLLAMSTLAVQMVRDCLDAFARSDPKRARAVCALGDEVDRQRHGIVRDLTAMIRERPDRVEAGLTFFSAARYLERIADHATNIAEDVIYLKEGKIIRHHGEEDKLIINGSTRPQA